MKKTLLSFAMLLSVALAQPQVAKAQTASLKWKVSVGVGLSSSESMNLGFAKGVQVSYDANIFEFGLSLHHASSQTLSTSKTHGLGFHNNAQGPSVQISQGDDRNEHNSANTSSINFFAGVDLFKAFKVQGRNRLILGALAGIGQYDSSFIINNPEGMTIDVRHGGLWGYGVKGSYEYMITKRVGAGFSATYDFSQDNFYGLANLIVQF
ncbi:hypothetical protein JJE62_07815 [Alloprevotella tannerae]|uniref:hypothetical protein n=1 Tax=Alloprevotella tannerae TaxID=76122 RepID=UPI001EDB58AB|nr:hypothetical protein [Alloprevotella tannerae]MCG2647358.1 hypothetical protein [Alloprevotella tannerae]